MKKLIYLVVFLLTLSLALAITVKTDKTDYNGNELVTINTDCLGTSIVKIIDPFDNLVDIKSGENSWKAVYNTLSSSSDGKYKITASYQDGITESYFCVDDPGCTVQPPVIQQQPPAQQPADGGGGGGGGGWGCTPKWSCSDWSYCAANLQQTRTCSDQKNCQANKEENQDCLQCDESWICSLWSECAGGQNYRTCVDEHSCGTIFNKPEEYKSCSSSSPPGPVPAQVSLQIPPPKQLPAPSEESFLSKYLFHLIAGVSGLVVLVLIILLTVHFLKPKKASNIDELKEWVKKEKAMGASESSIRQSLAEKTDWKENEINEAFKGL